MALLNLLGRWNASSVGGNDTHTSRGRIDIRLLPSIVPEDVRNETAAVIAPELQARITKLRNLIDAGILELEAASGM
jgi:hypothetical protein